MNNKKDILRKVSKALENSNYEKKEVKYVSKHIKSDGDLLGNCIENFQTNKTEVVISKEEKLKNDVENILKSLNSKNLLHSSNLPFDVNDLVGINPIQYEKSVDEMQDVLFECDTSIIKAKLAVSNLGIFCVTSDEQPRLMSLLPQNCIILLKKEDIVASMDEAYTIIKKNKNPTNIIFISGPSRTADIELIVVLGVHGPQKVYGLIY